MEKVIAVSGMSLETKHFKEVNESLQNGWSVKSINTAATKEFASAVIFLEKL